MWNYKGFDCHLVVGTGKCINLICHYQPGWMQTQKARHFHFCTVQYD